MSVLRVGAPAIWDSFAGPVPIAVLEISGPSGLPSSRNMVRFRLTANRGPYKKGEEFTESALHVAPRASLISRKGQYRIKAYTVEGSESVKNNPRRKNPATEVTELVLYAENTGPGSRNSHEVALYNQRVSIIANLKRRVAKNQYDPRLAAKLWGYWADSAAKAYNVVHGSGTYSVKGSPFSPADRREAAKQFEQNFREEIHEGRMVNPKKKRRGRKPMSAAARAKFAARMKMARMNKGLHTLAAKGAKRLRQVRRAKRDVSKFVIAAYHTGNKKLYWFSGFNPDAMIDTDHRNAFKYPTATAARDAVLNKMGNVTKNIKLAVVPDYAPPVAILAFFRGKRGKK